MGLFSSFKPPRFIPSFIRPSGFSFKPPTRYIPAMPLNVIKPIQPNQPNPPDQPYQPDQPVDRPVVYPSQQLAPSTVGGGDGLSTDQKYMLGVAGALLVLFLLKFNVNNNFISLIGK